MPRGRAKPPLVLTEEERETLERWARRPTTAQALALRARIVLRCALGQQNQDVAREIGVTRLTVGRWRQRFVTKRLDGLLDEPRPGAPRTVTDAAVERVVRLTLETTPQDATHWSTRAMAKRSEEHTSELQSPCNLVCRLLLEKKKKQIKEFFTTTQAARGTQLLSHL